MLQKAGAIFDGAMNTLTILAGAIYVFVLLSIGFGVVMRYFLHRPVSWVVEISEYSLVWLTFLVCAWLLKREGHVKMDLVLNRLNPRARALMNISTSVIGAIVCLVIVWYGVKATWGFFQLGEDFSTLLAPPKWPLLAIIPVGIFMLFIQFMRRIYGYLGNWRASPD